MANITIPELDPLENVPDDAIIYVVVDGQDYRTTKGELLQSITSQISSALSGYATELYADAKVADTITDGVTTVAPSQNAVFDALTNKQDTLTAVNAGAFETSLTTKNTLIDADTVASVNSVDGKLVKTSWLNVWLNYFKAKVGTGTANRIAKFTADGSIANSQIFDNGSQVGIGVASTSARLDVRAQGALSTDTVFRVRNSADTANLINVNGLGVTTISTAITDNNNAPLVVQNLTPYSTPFTQFIQIWKNSVGTVMGSLKADGTLNINNSVNSGTLTVSTTGNGTSILAIARANNGFWFPNNDSLGINTNGSERMRITSTGNVGIGTTTPVATAILQVDSTTKGFLPPRMTNAQRLAIASPAIGLCVYCTDAVEGLYINKSTGWILIG